MFLPTQLRRRAPIDVSLITPDTASQALNDKYGTQSQLPDGTGDATAGAGGPAGYSRMGGSQGRHSTERARMERSLARYAASLRVGCIDR